AQLAAGAPRAPEDQLGGERGVLCSPGRAVGLYAAARPGEHVLQGARLKTSLLASNLAHLPAQRAWGEVKSGLRAQGHTSAYSFPRRTIAVILSPASTVPRRRRPVVGSAGTPAMPM